MIEYFSNINSQVITAAIIGLAVALNPCIIAANISALSYMTEGHDKTTIYSRGGLYIAGRIVAFSLLGILLHFFADMVDFGAWVQNHMGKIIGPAFIVAGLILLNIIHIHVHSEKYLQSFKKEGFNNNLYAPFIIGFILAFAFCPEGAAMYFGSMVPLLANCNTESATLLVSFSFAIGSVVPIFPVLYIMSKGSERLASFKEKHQNFEVWVRRFIAFLFIIAGILFVFEYYIE